MSVSLTPSSTLGFNRPFTQLVKRTLTITNPNGQAVAFKVKTTAPKLYCVRPNSGKVEPGGSIEVHVMLQPMKEEPPLSAKCKDKFLIQSTLITPEKETIPAQDIWSASDAGGEESKVYQQKLKVTFLPAEWQDIPEDDEGPAASKMHPHDSMLMPPRTKSRYETVRQPAGTTNGHTDLPSEFTADPSISITQPQDEYMSDKEPATPPHKFSAAHEQPMSDEPQLHGGDRSAEGPALSDSQHSPPVSEGRLPDAHQTSSDSTSIPLPGPPPHALDTQAHLDLLSKYTSAQAEIERLRALIAAAPSDSSPGSTVEPRLRRRNNRALSDDGSTIAGTDVGTAFADDQAVLQPEGVPLQVVLIIALGVFITTYLFF